MEIGDQVSAESHESSNAIRGVQKWMNYYVETEMPFHSILISAEEITCLRHGASNPLLLIWALREKWNVLLNKISIIAL